MSYAQIFKKLFQLLNAKEKRAARWLFALMLATALVEVFGVASIMPFVALLSDPAVVQSNPYLAQAYAISGLQSTQQFLAVVGVVVFVLFFGALALKALTTYAVLKFTYSRAHSFAHRLLMQYMQKPYDFYLQRNTADLTKTIFSEVNEVTNGVILSALRLLSSLVVVLSMFAFLVWVNPFMTFVAMGVIGGGFGLAFFLTKTFLKKNGKKRLEYNKQRFIVANEALNGFKELSLMGRQSFYTSKFEKVSFKFASIQAVSKAMGDLPVYAVQALAFGGILGFLVYATLFGTGLKELVPLFALYAFAGYRLLPMVQVIFKSSTEMRFYSAALNNLHNEMGDSTDVMQPLPNQPMELGDRLFGDIEVKNLSYHYPGASKAALTNVSLIIPQGSLVAFVGSSGAGKSTMVDLLLGLLKPTAGSISVGGQDISISPPLDQWQRNIGYVPQSIYLCDGTVAENIAFGIPASQIDMEAVRKAAQAAHIHQFVQEQLPQRYDTRVGERGVRLSGGQRQRLGIARALYHNPQVVVFDEATSALDNGTESAVMEAINDLAGHKTILLVAHRLSTIVDCELIFLFEDGRLTVGGKYNDLLSRSPTFHKMVSISSSSL